MAFSSCGQLSASVASASILSKTSVRKALAASGLRSKYQRNASRNSASASGRIATLKRVTRKTGARGLHSRSMPWFARNAAHHVAAGVLVARLQTLIDPPCLPDYQSTPQPQQNAPQPGGRGLHRVRGLCGLSLRASVAPAVMCRIEHDFHRLFRPDHFDVGITNSAPFSMLSGQRCMMDFCLV